MPTEQFRAAFPNELSERLPGQRPGGNDALIGAAVDEFPGLGEVVAGGKLAAEGRGEAASAPQVTPVDRLQGKRRQHVE
jgi:hypothetical protein